MTVERDDVRAAYDRIAGHFASTREHPWPEVERFLGSVDGETGLDVGCGNCRHTHLLSRRTDRAIGLDLSRRLLEIGRDRADERGFEVTLLQGDAGTVPLADGTVDVGVYVAALHHLPTRADRLTSLDELARVLDPDGRALVSAWSTAHDRFEETTAFDTTIEWTLPDGETVGRFYHIYAPNSFDDDLAASDLVVLDSTTSSGNCYATVAGSP